jgi:hypothetical protein
MSPVLSRILFIVGYLSMVGPPRAVGIHSRAQANNGELAGKPLFLVVLIELMLRAGLLIVTAFAVTELVGREAYERYRGDMFLIGLVVSGCVHTLFYYVCFDLLHARLGQSVTRLYRVGRNLAYAVVPAFFTSGVALAWQEMNQRHLFSGDLVTNTFLGTWVVMVLIGMIEALLVNRHPLGLDNVLR